ncbi:MAG: FAD binding domain-containing protein [Deltaproteobacteria bacterium]|nr:FAD binding domain-containing protein [Deltaproteobacteria bacterium]
MLRLPPAAVSRPRSLGEALEALSSPDARVLAGGTDLLVALKLGLGSGPGPARLVCLSELPLAGIETEDGGYRLGATTTLWDLSRWNPPPKDRALGILAEASRQVAAPPLQSRATLGGNLCLDTRCVFYNQSAFWRSGRPACHKTGGRTCHAVPGGSECFACHQSDLAPVAVALGATVRLESAAGTRDLPAESLYSGKGLRPLTLAPGELLTSVSVPASGARAGTGWEKLRLRKGLEFALASAAVYLEAAEDGVCREACVVLGAVGSGPLRVREAEEALRGTTVGEDALAAAAGAAARAARPVKNVDTTPSYRREVAGVAVVRATRRAWDMATGREHR